MELTSSAWLVRLVPYSSKVGVLLLLWEPPTPAPTGSWLSPIMRTTCTHASVSKEQGDMCSAGACAQGGRATRALLPSHESAAGDFWTHLVTNLAGLRAHRLQHTGSDALALAQEAEEDVLGADVAVACMATAASAQGSFPAGLHKQLSRSTAKRTQLASLIE